MQMAEYEDKDEYALVMAKLSKVPGLIQAAEADRLMSQLASAARGESFIIQGGDCAERFMDCEPDRLEAQLKMMVQMGAIVESATSMPVVRIARIAGQYGKPRSKPTENVPGFGEIYSFKGDNINGYAPEDRKWDPKRLLEGYWHSCSSLNFLRSMQMGEDFSSAMLSPLNIDFLQKSPSYSAWAGVVKRLKEHPPNVNTGVFTAHEAMQARAKS
jgi:3-deoxy-7-phosphoheptulonate synthase